MCEITSLAWLAPLDHPFHGAARLIKVRHIVAKPSQARIAFVTTLASG